MWLVSGPAYDEDGRLWSVSAPAADRISRDEIKAWLDLAPKADIVLDGVYRDQDEEYADLRILP